MPKEGNEINDKKPIDGFNDDESSSFGMSFLFLYLL